MFSGAWNFQDKRSWQLPKAYVKPNQNPAAKLVGGTHVVPCCVVDWVLFLTFCGQDKTFLICLRRVICLANFISTNIVICFVSFDKICSSLIKAKTTIFLHDWQVKINPNVFTRNRLLGRKGGYIHIDSYLYGRKPCLSRGQLESVVQRLCLCPEGWLRAEESEREVKRNIHKPLLLFYKKCAPRGTSPCRLIHQAHQNTARTAVDMRLTTWHWQLVRHGCRARKGRDQSGDLSKNKQVQIWSPNKRWPQTSIQQWCFFFVCMENMFGGTGR